MAGGGHSWRPTRAPMDGDAPVNFWVREGAADVQLGSQTSRRGLIASEDGGRNEPATAAHWPAAAPAAQGRGGGARARGRLGRAPFIGHDADCPGAHAKDGGDGLPWWPWPPMAGLR
jgi:hypothetical protein